jgi:dipeptide transport system ATP-binding protein
MALLEVNTLSVRFGRESAPFLAVDSVDLTVAEGEVLGIVGESGSGKSVMSLAIMGLIDFPGRVDAFRMLFDDRNLLGLSAKARRRLVGKDIAMVFQDPMTSLNPCYTVGFQIMEALKVHEGGSRGERRRRTVELLEQVGIPDPVSRLEAFPHQLSGGMSQRVMIAMAIACNPRLLIADEPTTALDVTIQAQILDLLRDLQRQRGMALMLITHDLAVVAETCERVVVMYAGQVVETGPVAEVFRLPRHPYTAALLNALPERSEGHARLSTIAGVVPGQYDRPSGCLLNPRCGFATDRCRSQAPLLRLLEGGGQVRCHTPLDEQGRPSDDDE